VGGVGALVWASGALAFNHYCTCVNLRLMAAGIVFHPTTAVPAS